MVYGIDRYNDIREIRDESKAVKLVFFLKMGARQTKIANRDRIIGMRESYCSPCEISRELGISQSMVYWWIRWEEEGTLNDHLHSAKDHSSNVVKIHKGLQLPLEVTE